MGVIHTVSTMKTALFLLSCLVALAVAGPVEKNVEKNNITCNICKDLLHDLAGFITSDTTQDQIIAFVHELCHLLGVVLGGVIEEECNTMFDTNLPDIIDQIINDADGEEICTNLGLCP